MAAIFVDERAAAVIVLVGVLVLWAVLAPESFNGTIDTVVAVIEGAIDGATGAA